MTDSAPAQITAAIDATEDPALGMPLRGLYRLRDAQQVGGRVAVQIETGYPGHGPTLAAALQCAVEALPGVERAEIHVASAITAHAARPEANRLQPVKNIIAVTSAKGGVGKSTVAVNIALALAAAGARTGMLDADIYGPSLPHMLGLHGAPSARDDESFEPMVAHGVTCASLGHFIDADDPMIWRAPMANQALQELLFHTNWPALDYLIVDMPPGTGDIQLTMAQHAPLAGAVIVTTPQEIAAQDTRKGLRMLQRVNVPVLGVVENMSAYICPCCGRSEPLFGSGGAERIARDHGLDLLGALPLAGSIREHADGGRPSVIAAPHGEIAEHYRRIALRMAAGLCLLTPAQAATVPRIVVEES